MLIVLTIAGLCVA